MSIITSSNIERKQAITDIILSVALEQAAVSHILNAESEKLHLIIQSGYLTPEQILKFNDSVTSMIKTLTHFEMILQTKLNLFRDVLIPPAPVKFYFKAINLKRGKTFRTVDATYSFSADEEIAGLGTVYYLLLKPTVSAPSADDIIYFNNREELANGVAARGIFTINFTPRKQINTRVLSGREIELPFNDETGVVDGYRYNLFMVAELNGLQSEVTTPNISAIGMPYNHGEGTAEFPFGLREINTDEMSKWPDLVKGHVINRAGVTETARILDNIEGMTVLYEDTDGLYGLNDTLTNSFSILTDFDLSNYNGAYNGAGWRPIGNMNYSLAKGIDDHIFSGTIKSYDTRKLISSMPINQTTVNTQIVAYTGLFGKVQSAVISDIDITNSVINADISDNSKGYIGTLAGFYDGDISIINISNSTITTSVGAGNTAYTGGITGFSANYSNIKDISVNNINITATGSGTPHAGGIIGGITPKENDIITVSDLSVNTIKIYSRALAGGVFGSIITGGKVNINGLYPHDLSIQVSAQYAGGITGILFVNGKGNAVVDSCTSDGTLIGGEFIGGIIGRIGVNSDLDPSVCLIKNCIANAKMYGYSYVGGLIGNASRATILNCSTTDNVAISDTGTTTVLSRPFGGLIGGLDESVIRDCSSDADVLTPFSSRVGGLIGNLTATLTGTEYEVTNCFASGNVSGVSYIGGLIGGYTTETVQITFESCYATGDITSVGTGNNSAGGFIGAGKMAVYHNCYALGKVTGRSNIGGFIGDSTLAAYFIECYSKGDVYGIGTSVAGFIGSVANGTFEKCFSTGNVIATTNNAGSFVSNFTNASSATDCYAVGNSDANGNVSGFAQGTVDCTLTRCYAAGNAVGTGAAGGVIASGFTSASSINSCFALNQLVSAGGTRVYGRVAASSSMLSLNNNSAINTLQLMQNGVVKTPTSSGASSKDGTTVTQSNLMSAMQSAGWDSDVWNFSTISSLGRPILVKPPEQ